MIFGGGNRKLIPISATRKSGNAFYCVFYSGNGLKTGAEKRKWLPWETPPIIDREMHLTISPNRSDLQVPGETLEKGMGVSDGAARKPLVGCSGELQGFRKSQI